MYTPYPGTTSVVNGWFFLSCEVKCSELHLRPFHWSICLFILVHHHSAVFLWPSRSGFTWKAFQVGERNYACGHFIGQFVSSSWYIIIAPYSCGLHLKSPSSGREENRQYIPCHSFLFKREDQTQLLTFPSSEAQGHRSTFSSKVFVWHLFAYLLSS